VGDGRRRRYPARLTGDIELNFIDRKGLHVQAMALDCRHDPWALCTGGERR
jgi:hypothetical protein